MSTGSRRAASTRRAFTCARRKNAKLLAGFGALALALAAIGIYRAPSRSVARRTSELGIRLAPGAAPGALRRMIVRESPAPVACVAVRRAGRKFPVRRHVDGRGVGRGPRRPSWGWERAYGASRMMALRYERDSVPRGGAPGWSKVSCTTSGRWTGRRPRPRRPSRGWERAHGASRMMALRYERDSVPRGGAPGWSKVSCTISGRWTGRRRVLENYRWLRPLL
jgi:hypothetical protein